MTKEDLLKALEGPIAKTKVERLAELASDAGFCVKDLLDITFYHKPKIAFRAAWLLEYVVLNSRDSVVPFWRDFLEKYPAQQNQSCCRHYTKIMMLLQKDRQALNKVKMDRVIEATFGWLIDPKMPVAVKANCLDVLFDLSPLYPWIREELKAEIEFLMKAGTAAIQVRGKKILQQL